MAKVLIAVSGTGGHVYPGVALAEELRHRHPEWLVLFAAARGKPGRSWIEAAGFPVAEVSSRGFARRPSWSWVAFPFALLKGALDSLALLRRERPDLVVGTGGYVSGPFVAFAALLGIPSILLEQNAWPGVATRIGSLVARQVHVADPESVRRLWRRGNARVSGNPVRRSVEEGEGARFRRELGIPEGKPLVLVIGGSQGAKALTEAAIGAARHLGADAPVRLVVQAGARGIEAAREAARDVAPGVLWVVPFVEAMGDAYAAADLVVARSGAMTLAELAAAGVPSVLVPYPFAAGDHQTSNAARFAAAGASEVIAQPALRADGLAARIADLTGDRERLASMADGARSVDVAGARARIADACEAALG
jgi:UDP-N-acetylglucosamine--N-acetylmuramyl-(pentapeptide) pyrophosphoryl-undecaprenol N-acetylglucosamine transferase